MGNEVFSRLNMSNYLIRNQRYDDAIKYLNELVESISLQKWYLIASVLPIKD